MAEADLDFVDPPELVRPADFLAPPEGARFPDAPLEGVSFFALPDEAAARLPFDPDVDPLLSAFDAPVAEEVPAFDDRLFVEALVSLADEREADFEPAPDVEADFVDFFFAVAIAVLSKCFRTVLVLFNDDGPNPPP